jgi:hypothetical protein
MDFINKLESIYGRNVPIFLDEIKSAMSEYSTSYIFHHIREAIIKGRLIRFEKSIYYIPTDTIFGKSALNTYRAIEKRYIERNGKRIGFYSGWIFLNGIGGTRQIPNVIEIVTNGEKTKKRKKVFGHSRLILRKPRCEVTNDNCKILQILELCDKPIWDKEAIRAISNYAKENNISEQSLLEYAKYYPAWMVERVNKLFEKEPLPIFYRASVVFVPKEKIKKAIKKKCLRY